MATTTDVPNVRQQANEEQVQVDLSNMIGRIKPKPVCLDATLRIQATSSDEISKVIFSTGFGSWMQKTSSKTVYDIGSQALSVVSSGSSTASRENGMSDATFHGTNESNDDAKQKVIATMPSSDGFAEGDFLRRKEESERMNLKIKTQTISRNGRQTQRYYTDPATSFLYRMTTGCIPILEDGKILLCSASRKCEWIIPKGGWENDEVMEESAIRETYEEAGVFGIIGPRLGEIAYETRKGKKRRIEFEQVQRKVKQIRESQSFGPKAKAVSPSGNDGIVPCLDMADFSKDRVSSSASIDSCRFTPDVDNLSVASETSLGQTHIKMSLFPLYVTEVLDEWPEQGRFRKVVDIDEAIRITEIRPYFQAALKELKERHLHVCPELQRDKLMSNTIRMTSVTRTENSMGEI